MYSGYVDYLVASKKSSKTIQVYTYRIQSMLDYIGKPETEITVADLISWQANISNKSSSTIHLAIYAVRSYFDYLAKIGIVSHEFAEEVRDGLIIPKVHNKEKEYPYAWMIRAMVDNARTERDKAIILLLATTGLRFSEMANITLDQYRNMGGPEHREIRVLGKGAKYRKIFINDETKLAIDCYLTTRNKIDGPWLFLSFGGKQLQLNNLNQTLKAVAKKAGISFYDQVTCHWLRVAYATTNSERGVSIATISSDLGHSNLSTTTRYVKHKQEDINNSMRVSAF